MRDKKDLGGEVTSLLEKKSELLFSLHRHFCFFSRDCAGELLLLPTLPKPFEELSLSYGWHQAPVTNQFLPQTDLGDSAGDITSWKTEQLCLQRTVSYN